MTELKFSQKFYLPLLLFKDFTINQNVSKIADTIATDKK